MRVTINTKGAEDMNKFLTSVLLCSIFVMPAFGGKDSLSEEVKDAWMKDTNNWGICGLNSPATGAMKKVGSGTGLLTKGDVYWIARELNANGGKFCPTQVGAGRNSAGDPYTKYYNAANSLGCIWLCKNGMGGDTCSKSVEEVMDVKPIVQTTEEVNADGSNIEDDVAMLVANSDQGCRRNKNDKPWNAKGEQEHDVVLAVTGYTDDGYGAYVQPLVVRAAARPVGSYWSDYGKGYAFAYVANNADKTLVCLKGYKHNASGNGCVKYTQEQADKEAAQAEAETAADNACSGWVISATDEFINTYDVKMIGNCNQYRCKDSSMGFKSSLDKTCVSCGADDQHGVNPDTGVCVSCSVKQTFSADEQYRDSGYCRDKVVFIPAAMQYGLNSTKDESLEKQCWHILYKKGVEEYKNCIFGQAGETK